MENITCSLPKQQIYFTVWHKNSMQLFSENIISAVMLCFVKNYGKYMHNCSTMFNAK